VLNIRLSVITNPCSNAATVTEPEAQVSSLMINFIHSNSYTHAH